LQKIVEKAVTSGVKFYVSSLKRAKMTTYRNFEELELWKRARELVNLIYSDFRDLKDYGFTL